MLPKQLAELKTRRAAQTKLLQAPALAPTALPQTQLAQTPQFLTAHPNNSTTPVARAAEKG
jgi:hypothetical protein